MTGKKQKNKNEFQVLYNDLSKVTKYIISLEDRELFASAFKGSVIEIRQSLKMIKILKNRTTVEKKHEMMEAYEEGLRKDLIQRASRLIKLIEDLILPVTSIQNYIYYTKMQADLWRYRAEASNSSKREVSLVQDPNDPEYTEEINTNRKQEAIGNAEYLYKKARALDRYRINEIISEYAQLAKEENENITKRPLIDETRLGLSLNYAVFLYEVKNHKKKALRILKTEINDALDEYDKWDPEGEKQIKHQIELIQENINLWKENNVDTDSEEEN